MCTYTMLLTIIFLWKSSGHADDYCVYYRLVVISCTSHYIAIDVGHERTRYIAANTCIVTTPAYVSCLLCPEVYFIRREFKFSFSTSWWSRTQVISDYLLIFAVQHPNLFATEPAPITHTPWHRFMLI